MEHNKYALNKIFLEEFLNETWMKHNHSKMCKELSVRKITKSEENL